MIFLDYGFIVFILTCRGEFMAESAAPKVHISADQLEASIYFPLPAPSEERRVFTKQQLLNILRAEDVVYGIDMSIIESLADHIIYDRELHVASGRAPEPGIQGYFEYKFDAEVDKSPTIREDGTADYRNIKLFEIVHVDDVIAIYHPAIQGNAGISVKNEVLEPVPVRDLPPIGGRGFERSEDGLTYTSTINGKIEMTGNRIIISPVFEITGSADLSTGNIIFNGDVVIGGGVCEGIIIKADGNVTIEGLVEHCEIYAGKDLVLKSGVKGGDMTVISAQGNITAEFLEYCTVKAGGDITADVLFKSNVECDGRIDLNGKKSAIIGGMVSAVQGIDVANVGNNFGTITHISVGVDSKRQKEMASLKNKIDAVSENIIKIKQGLEDFDRLGEERGVSYKDDPRRIQLLRVKIRDESVVAQQKSELERLERVAEGGKRASVRVFDTVFAGVRVAIDDHATNVNDYQRHIEFFKTRNGIRMDILEGIIDTDKR